MAAELLDAHQELHRRDPQLRDQFAGLQQRAQRNQHGADAGQRHRDLHPAGAVGHDQPDPGALADAGVDEGRGQFPCGRVEFAVADPGRGIDHHRLGAVIGRLRTAPGGRWCQASNNLLQPPRVDLAAGQQRNRRRAAGR